MTDLPQFIKIFYEATSPEVALLNEVTELLDPIHSELRSPCHNSGG
jgi:hypothetical protein